MLNNDEEYDMIVSHKEKSKRKYCIINDIAWVSYPKERVVFNTKENKPEVV